MDMGITLVMESLSMENLASAGSMAGLECMASLSMVGKDGSDTVANILNMYFLCMV